ncbi:amidohydrolase family protein [Candidatus Poribacteria bacterium]|nr:amidohydrolase family protein [Candidatus Poribacteria bacterium]
MMDRQQIVVDVHYHFLPIIPEDFIDLLTGEIAYGFKKRGEAPDQETLRRTARETLIDPEGALVLERDRQLGVDVTCINITDFPVPGIDAELVLRSNKIAADLARRNPEKFFAFAGIDPRRPAAAEIAKTCLENYGMIGIKWHPDFGFDPTSAEAYEVLKVLDKNNGILLTHTGYLPGGRCKYTSLSQICDILVDFPDLRVIAAHMGKTAWHEWAGLAHDFPNLYGDLAVWSRYADRNYEFFCRQLRELTFYAGVEKVLWGTDDPFENHTVPTATFVKMMRELPVKSPKGYEFSKEEVDLMLGGNAARLLGIK